MRSTRREYGSWSRVPTGPPTRIHRPRRVDEVSTAGLWTSVSGVLAVGAGRTYGDTCVNDGGIVIDTTRLDGILEFDAERGVVRCEPGVTLDALLALVLPRGWIFPACPGTASVTIAGAVAHDVHGKNQARAGNVGRWVLSLTLLRSREGRVRCSMDENSELFGATIGGLGLTGVIVEVELQLMPLASRMLRVERRRADDLLEALTLLRDVDDYDHGLAWVDSFRQGASGRGVYVVLRARHASDSAGPTAVSGPGGGADPPGRRWSGLTRCVARAIPAWAFRRSTLRVFNRLYARAAVAGPDEYVPLRTFLFPQDDLHATNRLYGRRGVLAHHSLIPRASDSADQGLRELLERAARPGEESLVTVLKAFGPHESPGMLSFSGEGTSVALGFPHEGASSLALLDELDKIVATRNGRVYPAKDARMPAATFRASFPAWREFARFVDPAHSSSFWRRVSCPQG